MLADRCPFVQVAYARRKRTNPVALQGRLTAVRWRLGWYDLWMSVYFLNTGVFSSGCTAPCVWRNDH